MRFTVLGQVELHVAGRCFDLGSPKQRAVIAALLFDTDRAVPVETLIDRVWDEAPGQVRGVVHTYVTRLRRVLAQAGGDEPIVLSYGAGSYRLEVAPDRVDLHRFQSLVDRGRYGDLADQPRAALLREALDLWRGMPLAGLRSEWAERVREDLKQQRLGALLALAALDLRLGRGAELVEELRATLVDNPLVEPLAAALMRALYQAGRAAEALQCYARFRRLLREELGTEPGAELRQAHEAILRDDVDQLPGAPVARPASLVPAQLPAPVSGFTGREPELAQLDAMLPGTGAHLTTVVISAVWGTAGVGKTALALHWAHRVRDRFPDGQLYINLRGFDPGGTTLTPAEAVREFLDALDVPARQIPASLDARAALYRSVLADRRMLVVLDNARDAEQVRPLLPGSAGCLGLVTSRNRLTSLVATEGAHPVALDLLTREESRDLLIRRMGPTRAAAEPAALDEIITACARLPLALAIVAARAATQPDMPLGALARELRGPEPGLNALSAGDAATDVRTVFSWSYAALTPAAARLFRLLGLHPGPDISAPAAASLAGTPLARARPLLDELTRANLLTRHPSGRYAFHDLLRAYAAEQATGRDDEADRRRATHRLLDHYVHTGRIGAQHMRPHDPIALPACQPGVAAEDIADVGQALDWYRAEHAVLMAAVTLAAGSGFDTHVCLLARTLVAFFTRRGHWQDWVQVEHAAIEAAQRQGDEPALARAHRNLADAYDSTGRPEDADRHYGQALALYEKLGDRTGQAHARFSLGQMFSTTGRPAAAIDHIGQALELYRATGNRTGEAYALNGLAWSHAQLEDFEPALTFGRRALAVLQVTPDPACGAQVWDTLGYVHDRLGRHDEATTGYRRALELCREAGNRYGETVILTHLGDAHRAVGDLAAARSAFREALEILHELRHPDASAVRAKLDAVPEVATGSRPH